MSDIDLKQFFLEQVRLFENFPADKVEEIVIKSLTPYLSEAKGFTGCTILGDGRVYLIADVEYLMNH